MDRYVTVEVPFQFIGNRRCLTRMQVEEHPFIQDFIERFRDSFDYDITTNRYFLIESED